MSLDKEDDVVDLIELPPDDRVVELLTRLKVVQDVVHEDVVTVVFPSEK